jgi:hypothetical protein
MNKDTQEKGFMPCNVWVKFTGQKLQTTDLVWFKNSGLAFVDSSSITGEPDRFTSIPEAWSFGSSVWVNRRTGGKEGYAHVKKSGWVYRDVDWISDGVGLKWDKITHVMRISKPIGKICLPSFQQFNNIGDLRPYFLRHPDKDMVERSCLHYLGDDAQNWYIKKYGSLP